MAARCSRGHFLPTNVGQPDTVQETLMTDAIGARLQEPETTKPQSPERIPGPAWFERALGAPYESLQVEVEGAMIDARVWGRSGLPGLLLLHGSRAHLGWWSYLAPFFQDHFRVAALSFSGMGNSDWRERYSTALWAREAWAVIEAGGLTPNGLPPLVAAHSFGSVPLLEMAADSRRPIRWGVMVDNVMPGTMAREAMRPGPHRVYRDLATALSRFRLVPAESCENDWIVDYLARMSLRRHEGGWTWCHDPGLWDRMDRSDPWEVITRLAAPMAVIRGEESALTGGETHARMVALLGEKPVLVSIPEAGHHVGADQPLALAAALRALIEPYR
jgi:pimeloyl-ACP methyl ester carboxylesterase